MYYMFDLSFVTSNFVYNVCTRPLLHYHRELCPTIGVLVQYKIPLLNNNEKGFRVGTYERIFLVRVLHRYYVGKRLTGK